MRRVAITGLGAVSALGVGVEAFWHGLVAGRSGVAPITLVDTSGTSVRVAAEVRDFDITRYLPSANPDLLDRFSQLALVSAAEALSDAGLAGGDLTPERCGVSFGSGMGGAATLDDGYLRFYGDGRRIHPFTIPRYMHNAAAAQVAMAHLLQGPALTFATACAAAAHAIGEAGEIIRAGRADVMLAGGSDAPITPGILRAWEAMRVMAPAPEGNPGSACRPFSRDRQGLVLGEGAGVVVLEDWDRARARGARVYAELAGYGATADAGHITQPAVEPPARAIRLALDQARLRPEDIGYVNAHGTGTRLNDATETTILKTAFGPHAASLAISSTKSMHGHAMGASAALELIATVLAIDRGVLPPTAHYNDPDPECDLDYLPNRARDRRVDAAISNSFAFGGMNAVLVVRRP